MQNIRLWRKTCGDFLALKLFAAVTSLKVNFSMDLFLKYFSYLYMLWIFGWTTFFWSVSNSRVGSWEPLSFSLQASLLVFPYSWAVVAIMLGLLIYSVYFIFVSCGGNFFFSSNCVQLCYFWIGNAVTPTYSYRQTHKLHFSPSCT